MPTCQEFPPIPLNILLPSFYNKAMVVQSRNYLAVAEILKALRVRVGLNIFLSVLKFLSLPGCGSAPHHAAAGAVRRHPQTHFLCAQRIHWHLPWHSLSRYSLLASTLYLSILFHIVLWPLDYSTKMLSSYIYYYCVTFLLLRSLSSLYHWAEFKYLHLHVSDVTLHVWDYTRIVWITVMYSYLAVYIRGHYPKKI